MRVHENHCYCCDLPCINCGRRVIEVIYCDNCKDAAEKMYSYNGEEFCYDCTKEAIFKDYIYNEKLENQIGIINQIVEDNFISETANGNYVIDKDYNYEYSIEEAIAEAMDYIKRDIELETIIKRLEIDCFLIN